MELSTETSVDDALGEIIQVIKRLHCNAVASLKRSIVRLRTELKECKAEKSTLVNEHDFFQEKVRNLEGKLSSKLNEKALLYQLLSTLTKAMSDPTMTDKVYATVESTLSNGIVRDAPAGCRRERNSYDQTTVYSDEEKNGKEDSTTGYTCSNCHTQSSSSGRLKQAEKGVRCGTGLEMTKDSHSSVPRNVCSLNPQIQSLSSTGAEASIDPSPFSHLLELISSTHQMTVTPLRLQVQELGKELRNIHIDIDDLRSRIEALRRDKDKVVSRLQFETDHYQRMKSLFEALSKHVASKTLSNIDLESIDKPTNDIMVHMSCSLPDDANIQDYPTMVRPWRETGNVVPPSSRLKSLSNEEIFLEIQSNEPVSDNFCQDTITNHAAPTSSQGEEPCGQEKLSKLEGLCTRSGSVQFLPHSPLENAESGVIASPAQAPVVVSTCCQFCGVNFPDCASLAKHKRSHRSSENVCRLCKRPFSSSTALKIHMRRHTGERPYLCQECGKSFAQAISLRIHLRKHTGERPHKCFECGREFHDPCYFKKHQRKHLESKNKRICAEKKQR